MRQRPLDFSALDLDSDCEVARTKAPYGTYKRIWQSVKANGFLQITLPEPIKEQRKRHIQAIKKEKHKDKSSPPGILRFAWMEDKLIINFTGAIRRDK